MPYLHHGVQPIFGKEDDHHQQCKSHLPHGTLGRHIDIGAHLFSILADATRTTSRPKLILPSLIMKILNEKGVETPQNISLMPTPLAINALTIIRSKVCLPGGEEEVDPTQE